LSSVPRLILASASPRRRQILGILRIPFEAIEVDVDETPRPGESPEALARRLALVKAEAGSARHPEALVLGADTVVEIDGQSLGKPRNAAEAIEMLRRLRGRGHWVNTALALVSSQKAAWSRMATTEVWMRSYTDAEIEEYVTSGDPFDKAGSYAIQHPTFRPVERIAGCFLNVVGLPLPAVVDLLRSAGISAATNHAGLEAACPGCADREILTSSS
jgi:septum formation protein